MTQLSYPARLAAAIEQAAIHAAVCRARAAELACSTCHDLDERAERLARRATIVEEAA